MPKLQEENEPRRPFLLRSTMNEKVQTTTKNADGVTVTVVADSFSALTTVVNLKKVDKKKGFNNA